MHQSPSKFAYVLLMLMSIFAFGGPFAIGRVLEGGEHGGWPPDRPVEWVTLVGVCGGVLVLMTTILAHGLTFQRRLARESARRKVEEGP